ncbi:hypothetical protein WN48_03955 [Eufriesea mexicana]|nr:hypothetical protein WN48_03955 [Eufriesea mexicana]
MVNGDFSITTPRTCNIAARDASFFLNNDSMLLLPGEPYCKKFGFIEDMSRFDTVL